MANEAISFYEPGRNITAVTSAAVTGKRFLAITGNRSTVASTNGNITVAHAAAAGRICGVSQADANVGQLVGVVRGNSRVVPVTAAAAITAFQEVEVGANGQAVPRATGVAVGYAITAAALGADAQISLY